MEARMDRDVVAAGAEINQLAADSLQEQHEQSELIKPRGPGRPFPPGQSGNPEGRRRGSRNHATLFAEALIDSEAEALVRTMIDKALYRNDPLALKLCVERILAPRRLERVRFNIPPLATPEDAAKALAAIAEAVAEGDLAPAEADNLSLVVDRFVHALEAQEFERRLAALESDMGRNG
jgi:hypothetical protein